MPYKKEYHVIVCKRCGIPFQILTPAYKRRLQDPVYGEICTSCRAKILQEMITPEVRKARSAKAVASAKKTRDSLSEEEKAKKKEFRKKKIQLTWKNKSDQEKASISEKRSKIQKDRIQQMSPEQRESIRQKMIATKQQKESAMTEEEKVARRKRIQEKRKQYWDGLSDEEKSVILDRLKQNAINQWSSLSEEEHDQRVAELHVAWEKWHQSQPRIEALPKKYRTPAHKPVQNPVKKEPDVNWKDLIRNRLERQFQSSGLDEKYYLRKSILSIDGSHQWDYGIYDRDHWEVKILIDLEGNETTESPEEVFYLVLHPDTFPQDFRVIVQHCIPNYKDYIDSIFQEMRVLEFPFPHYETQDLLKSYVGLLSVDENTSLHTRAGDRLIQHFHPSIYHAHRKGRLSPYDAWMDDVALKKCIENRVIYQNQLNPNKILQGFNVSKIAPKVSVFSAGRARILIQRYLKNATCIFDPFSGFSGRMLGTVSLGKQYIGQDYSSIHIAESNEMISFLKDYGMNTNASMVCRDVFQSHGEYEALFTCPPYGDLEQWLDVPVSNLSCDDWVSLCLQRF